MSTYTITQAVKPSFVMPAFGHAAIATPCALAEAGVAFEAKRRNAKGSPAWRPADC